MKPPYFDLIAPRGTEVPVVVEIPHAGLELPPRVLATLVAPARAVARDADLYVDELYENAANFGATVLIARVSRYALDLNRAADDIDAGVVAKDRRAPRPNARGLLWRTTTDGELALERPLPRAEYERRIAEIYNPYHEMLRRQLQQKIDRFGYVLLLCAHSMPSAGRAGHADAGVPRADVVPGTRGRTTAHARVIDAVEAITRRSGFSVEHDRPYRGGFSTGEYGKPASRCHAVQVELARRLYLDEQTLERIPAMSRTQKLCDAIVQTLAEFPASSLT